MTYRLAGILALLMLARAMPVGADEKPPVTIAYAQLERALDLLQAALRA